MASSTRRAQDVVALVRNPAGREALALAELGVQCVQGDVTDPESMRSGMQSADIVIYNAAWYELGVPKRAQPQMYAINVAGA